MLDRRRSVASASRIRLFPVLVVLFALSTGAAMAAPPSGIPTGARIEGTMRAAETGLPLADAYVDLLTEHFGIAETRTDASGRYVFTGVPAGRYFVQAFDFSRVSELYDDVSCQFNCERTLGTAIDVEPGSVVTGIDFELELLGEITGQVVDAANGAPVPDALVSAYLSNGVQILSITTDDAGRYSIPLPAGDYFLDVWSSDHVGEVYDNIPCLDNFGDCDDLEGGTLVTVASGGVTSGSDFAVDRGGKVSGRVTRAADGTPAGNIQVQLWTADGQASSTRFTAPDGTFSFRGLPAGQYVAIALNPGGLVSEVYPEQPCSLLFPPLCDPTSGTPIVVELGDDMTGIDFTLDPVGMISGRVTEADGTPIPELSLQLFDASGLFLSSATTDVDGRYTLFTPPRPVYVQTSHFLWVNEIYQDVLCFPHRPFVLCDTDGATPLEVPLGTTIDDIDFVLEPTAIISGRLTRAEDGNPVPIFRVRLWDADAQLLLETSPDPLGLYAFARLPTGTYFVTVGGPGSGGEVWNNVRCSAGVCDPRVGTPIVVTAPTRRDHIDFALERLAVIEGTVTDAANGAPLAEVTVALRRLDGTVVASRELEPGGRFRFTDLPPGTYSIAAGGAQVSDEVFADIPCPGEVGEGGCPAGGTAVEARVDEITRVDVALTLEQGLRGRVVREEDGQPLAEVVIEVFDADGLAVARVETGPAGTFTAGLPAGTYFVSTDNGRGGIDEVYDDLACPDGPETCEPLEGTAITVSADTPIAEDIDFVLAGATPRCLPSATRLCVLDRRFQVDVAWRSPTAEGLGQVRQLTDDTGSFWFFNRENIELTVKVLDACDLPSQRFWVFAGGLTNVATAITVTDLATGSVKRYTTELGEAFEPLQDTDAFATCTSPPGALASTATSAALAPEALPGGVAGDCFVDDQQLCLAGGRFLVDVRWSTDGIVDTRGTAVQLTRDTGYFWFFSSNNVEVVVKVLDACELDPFNNVWVFAAGLTNLQVELRVQDTETGEVREYVNPLHTPFAPIQDTGAFDVCF